MMANDAPLMEARDVSKYFGHVVALEDISMQIKAGEVTCLLGDNGAGKSTLIKIFSGVHQPDKGSITLDGEEVTFNSPRDAIDRGIATVYQDLAMIPLMGISRNFFLGREPTKGVGPLEMFDVKKADRITREELGKIGINLRDTTQPVATLSGGERQSVAIARAVYFGAKILILDEPTSALGVKQASIVLRYVARTREQGLGVIFITHNVSHALPIGDTFTILSRGRTGGQFNRGDVDAEALHAQMGGGDELHELTRELEALSKGERRPPAPAPGPSVSH